MFWIGTALVSITVFLTLCAAWQAYKIVKTVKKMIADAYRV